eukprot:11225993-Lingulodinium_polyedra.AAC.1
MARVCARGRSAPTEAPRRAPVRRSGTARVQGPRRSSVRASTGVAPGTPGTTAAIGPRPRGPPRSQRAGHAIQLGGRAR